MGLRSHGADDGTDSYRLAQAAAGKRVRPLTWRATRTTWRARAKALGVPDLGQDRGGQDWTDPEDRLQRLQTLVGLARRRSSQSSTSIWCASVDIT
jgi:hypothetical protein